MIKNTEQIRESLDSLPLEAQRRIYRAVWNAFEARKTLADMNAHFCVADKMALDLFEATGYASLCCEIMASQLADYVAGRDEESFLWRCSYLNVFSCGGGVPPFVR
jgi:hypothetical protein